jgi:RNA polymerase sigma factor (sigma-70 family)
MVWSIGASYDGLVTGPDIACHLLSPRDHHIQMIDDAELVERSRRQDANAFGELVARHQQLVFGVALARCHDPALAEDVAQEAFVAAWRDLGRLRDADRVGPWVAGIARNLASNAVRVRDRREQIALPVELDAPSPRDEALEREDRELIQRALEAVPEPHRETLVLYYMHGESIATIATALGIREDLVKQRLSRGRKALRDSIAERVESTLTRTRLRGTFGAGVMAAATSRKTHAARAARKVLVVTTATKVSIATLVLIIATGAIWWHKRERPVATTSSSSAMAQPMRAPTDLHVERLTDPKTRGTLLEAIRKARAASGSAASSSSAPGARTAPPALSSEPPMDKRYIRAAVHEILPMLSQCYEEGLARKPALAGKVVVDFTIEGEPDIGGVVGESSIDAAQSDLDDATVDECIEQTMYALKIDPPPGGGVVHVTYPFTFAPAQ